MINGHGDDAYRYTAIRANFSSNVYHRVNHDGLNRYLSGCLSCIRSYPEPEPYALAAELAQLHGVSPEEVCVTNGATEAIYLIAQTFAEVILPCGYRPLVNMQMPVVCTNIEWKAFPAWRS